MPHLSYSALTRWCKCPYNHKIHYIDGIKLFTGNIHTAFGSAIHSTNEKILHENIPLKELDEKKNYIDKYFKKVFQEEIDSLPDEEKLKLENEYKELYKNCLDRGTQLAILAIKELHKKFPGFKVISVEEEIVEPITEFIGCNKEYRGFVDNANYDFKGFKDLVLETPDKKRKILDWKVTSWGWKPDKKADKMVTYQLTFYKHFHSLMHDKDLSDIEVYFGLIKRDAFDKDGNPKKDVIEIFEVKCGPRKIKNALNVLNQAVYNIEKKNFVKNKLSCSQCEFNFTKYCDSHKRRN